MIQKSLTGAASLPDTDTESFVEQLLQKMTLQEKVGQMVQVDLHWKEPLEPMLRAGRVGSLLTVRDPAVINSLQHIAVSESRLGIPLLVGNDVIHGHRTIFPIPLALASSWDLALIEEVAQAAIREAVACGANWDFAPMVDICRDPRWGRVSEGAGEDAYLGSQVARAYVRGFQAPIPALGNRRAAACVKHFAAYGGSESGKDYNSVDMSERRLREEYLPPYKAAIQAGALTVMTAFNDLNGVPASANAFLLQQILRQEWGFDGLILSDYDAIGELVLHGFASDLKEATLRSILAGVDMDMMSNAYHFHLADLVRAGKVPEALIDAAVRRILKLKVTLGLFERPYIDEAAIAGQLKTPEALKLGVKAAEQSMVLLKNEDGLLPLELAGKTIALIGPLAFERESLMGCWNFDGQAEDVQTIAENFQANLPAGARLICERGCSVAGPDHDFSAAIQAANQADLVILALGELDTMDGEAHCRAHLGLPGQQQALTEAVAACGKPLIALLVAGRPLTIPWMAGHIPAILMAWNGGTRAAQAIFNVLTGKTNPAGKLTASWPRSEGQIPVYYAHKSTGRPYDTSGTTQFNRQHKSSYLDEPNEPLFPFGYGLAYTHFTYEELTVSTPIVHPGEKLVVSAIVTNKGARSGQEVVQCYLRDLTGVVTRPVKELKGFQKINLAPGECKTVTFEIPVGDLSFYNLEMQPVIEAGDYLVWIGPNSAEGLLGSFSLVDNEI